TRRPSASSRGSRGTRAGARASARRSASSASPPSDEAGAPERTPLDFKAETGDEGDAMAYSVPDLPYDYGALEPHIDEATMRVPHDKHHQAYVDKANAALEGTEWADKDVDEVLRSLDQLPGDIRT